MNRHDLTDFEWSVIEPLLPNKPLGVPRVDDRRVLNGILWVLCSGAPWRDLPERYEPYSTCCNRFNRWRKKGIWDQLKESIVEAYDGSLQMINSSSVHRVHQHAGGSNRGDSPPFVKREPARASTRAGHPVWLLRHAAWARLAKAGLKTVWFSSIAQATPSRRSATPRSARAWP